MSLDGPFPLDSAVDSAPNGSATNEQACNGASRAHEGYRAGMSSDKPICNGLEGGCGKDW